MSLPRLDRIDRFGCCAVCTRNLITKRIVDGKEQIMFVPEYGHLIFLLNSGSKMQVTICKICQNTYDFTDPEIHKDIMGAVQKGWELEVGKMTTAGNTDNDGNYTRWSEEFGQKFLASRRKLNINCHADPITDHILIKRSQGLAEEFHAQMKAEREQKQEVGN